MTACLVAHSAHLFAQRCSAWQVSIRSAQCCAASRSAASLAGSSSGRAHHCGEPTSGQDPAASNTAVTCSWTDHHETCGLFINRPTATAPPQDRLPMVKMRPVLVRDDMAVAGMQSGPCDRIEHTRRQAGVSFGDAARRRVSLNPPNQVSHRTPARNRREVRRAPTGTRGAVPQHGSRRRGRRGETPPGRSRRDDGGIH